MKPGDIVVTDVGGYWYHPLIEFGQRVRYGNKSGSFTGFTHAAIVYSEDGDLIEALGTGVERTHISRYANTVHAVLDTGLDDRDREQAVNFALSVADARREYGWITIASIAFSLLTGSKLTVSRAGTAICSGLVAEALAHGGEIFDNPPSHVMPAELAARYWNGRG